MVFNDISSEKHQVNPEISSSIFKFINYIWEDDEYSQDRNKINFFVIDDKNEFTLESLSIIFEMMTGKEKTTTHNKSTSELSIPINYLTDLFLGEIADKSFDFNRATSLTILFLNGYQHLGINEFSISVKMFDNMLEQFHMNRQTKNEDIDLLDFIFSSLQALFSSNLYQYQIDFVTRRRLLGYLVSKFITLFGTNPDIWQKTLIDKSPTLYLFVTILDGLAEFVKLMIFHSYEIPITAHITNLLKMAINILSFTQNIALSYFLEIHNFPDPFDSISDFVSRLQEPLDNNLFSKYLIAKIENILVITARYRLMMSSISEESQLSSNEILYQLEIMETIDSISETHTTLYFLDAMLYQGKYPFDKIYIEIENEIAETKNVLKSSTFEEEIVRYLNDTILYLTSQQKLDRTIDIEAYEIIIYFTGEWLQIFSKDIHKFHEAIVMFTAIIISCQVHIIQGYYNFNKVDKAFLSYLNLYYFSELMNKVIYSGIPISDREKFNKYQIGDILSQFNSMTHNWNAEFFDNEDVLKVIATSIELSMTKSKNASDPTVHFLTGALDEATVLDYVDLADNLAIFLEIANKQPITLTLDQLNNFNIYQPSSSIAPFRFQRIGSEATKRGIQELPFPFIKNIHTVAAAMSNFPLDPEVVSIDIETIINSLSKYIDT